MTTDLLDLPEKLEKFISMRVLKVLITLGSSLTPGVLALYFYKPSLFIQLDVIKIVFLCLLYFLMFSGPFIAINVIVSHFKKSGLNEFETNISDVGGVISELHKVQAEILKTKILSLNVASSTKRVNQINELSAEALEQANNYLKIIESNKARFKKLDEYIEDRFSEGIFLLASLMLFFVTGITVGSQYLQGIRNLPQLLINVFISQMAMSAIAIAKGTELKFRYKVVVLIALLLVCSFFIVVYSQRHV